MLPLPPTLGAASTATTSTSWTTGARTTRSSPPRGPAYLWDLPEADLTLLDTGHFALEEDGVQMAARIRRFLNAIAAQ